MAISKQQFAPYLVSVTETEKEIITTVEIIEKIIDQELNKKTVQDDYARYRGTIDIDTGYFGTSNAVRLKLVILYAQKGWLINFSKKSFESIHIHLS